MSSLRYLILIGVPVLAFCELASAQDESQAAKTTRKALQKTIDVDQKDVGTKDFFDEISSDLDNKVKFKIDNASGVSNNAKITYKAKAVTVEKMLNELADKYDWGWYVMSNASNNTVDGRVIIRKSTKGKERGYEAGKAPKKAAGDLDKLQGKWTIAALEVNGMNVAPENLEGTVLTIEDDSYVVKLKDQTIACRITLDPAKDPKEIDMYFLDGANKDKTQKGIYKIGSDTFQMARGLFPDQERPREFATWPDTNYFVVTWKMKTP
jgi:uncharacterized protein (TIGR03067 family)